MSTLVPLEVQALDLGPGPFVFTGVPPLLTGDIELGNPGGELVRPRRLEVKFEGEVPPQLHGVTSVAILGRLDAGAREFLAAHVEVPGNTPPGRYQGTLSSGVVRRELVLAIFEKSAVEVYPHALEVTGRPGELTERTIVVVNRGNGSRMIPAARSLTAHGQREFHVGFEPAGLLEAGVARDVALNVRIPDDLPTGRAYALKVRLLDVELLIDVNCTEPDPEPKKPRKERS